MLASKTALKNAFEAMGVGMASALTGDLAWAIVAIARCLFFLMIFAWTEAKAKVAAHVSWISFC